MKRYISSITYSWLIAALLAATIGCKKDYQDPSGPSAEEAYSTVNAVTNAAVGLQNWYSRDRVGLLYTTVTSGSLLTGETFVTNRGNTDEAQLGTGGSTLLNNNIIVTGMWAVTNKINYEADSILRRSQTLAFPDKGYASGLVAYTSIFKALAIGVQANFWEKVPSTSGKPNDAAPNVTFISGKDGYKKAVAVLDNAINAVNAAPISDAFLRNIPKSINVVNTLYALKARYALYAGDYTIALEAAGKVDLTANGRSSLQYNPQVMNPIFTLVTSTNNIYQVVDSAMGLPVALQPDLTDKRVPFYISRPVPPGPRFSINGFFSTNVDSVPIFLPGEILLIQAECHARQHNVEEGLKALNRVVTKKPADDPFRVGADLPKVNTADEATLLTLIYKHRRIELFMGGQELEDSRRFGRPVTERKRNYFPYPFVERNDNPNTPDDPAF
ncbi:RagB/SusD family nutrient uptake outer membrane protein [Chitinophaga nivalis]|uniref:RagB/SusD family nutrient uptake outer membrane protein n=1 Tax=Chitinophaga nivalis TaxID=2991709 RepID=A0ABT3IT59_9BACT|nr:RagB/SusD family nutrient uptake outer membrane protein [Chitinophaga nivalis]MCW3463143.1 RagB/SusD family nutrient uptake outer membrane protein [Chitinophaga nivalis]MCW3487167.1 RagB/SusD family nutrient uptake outer membrane protein [Chitinophaga nivalis]